MGGTADLEHEHQLVLAPIERPHAAVGLVPDAQVLELGKDRPPGRQQFAHMAPVHADERDGAVAAGRGGMPKRRLQEGRECLARHFAGPHGELAMADAAEPAHVSIDRNIVGRISEDEIGAFVAQKALERLTLSRIPTQEPVAPEQPQVARPGHPEGGIDKRRGGVLCIVGRIRRRLSGFVEQHIDFSQREPGDLDIEFEIDERLQFDGENLAVPAGVEGQLVVGQHIGSALRRIEVGEAQRRNALNPKQLGGLHPAVPGDDLGVIADEDRIGEAEPLNAVGDLTDLLFGMNAGVLREGPQACDRHRFNGHRFHVGCPGG